MGLQYEGVVWIGGGGDGREKIEIIVVGYASEVAHAR
jgi:hypothetical protein